MTRTPLRRTVLIGVAAVAAATLAACGSSSTATSASSTSGSASAVASSAASSAAATFNDADVAFAQGMVPHHQQAVAMAVLAATRAGSAQVKKLAQRIEAAQGPEITTMTGWLTAWGKSTGMSMNGGSMPGMMSDSDMSRLKARTGAAFDKQFLTMMIAHHQGAITMASTELAGGANGDAKALAQKISTAQQGEITTMKGLLR